MPIWNWLWVFKTGDLGYLLIRKTAVSKPNIDKLSKHWEKLWDEYIQKFGFGEQMLSIHSKNKEIALLRLEKIKTGDRSYNTFIAVALIELETLKAETVKGDFWTMKVAMEKQLGFRIDLKNTTVIEFYSQLKFIQKTE